MSRVADRPPLGAASSGASAPVGERQVHAVAASGRGAWGDLATARLALALVLGVRLALSPFASAVGQPDSLWHPRGIGHLFPSPPPVPLVVGLQVLGVGGAALYLWRRRLPPLVVAWVCLLLLAGLRTSLGKVLHNDVLLVLAAMPLLLAGSAPSEEPGSLRRPPGSSEELEGSIPTGLGALRNPGVAALRRWKAGLATAGEAGDRNARTGLDCAAAIVLLSYLSSGWWKLLHSGPAWALSDNLRWSLAAGRGGARWPGLSGWLVEHPSVCIVFACGILALEISAPVLWIRPRLTPAWVAAAALLHGGTWIVLGLDYWAHLAMVALVLLPWARMRRR